MDGVKFDNVAKALAGSTTRRLTIGALVAGALHSTGLGELKAANSSNCPRKCGSCQKCKKGSCRRRNGKKRCTQGHCRSVENDSICETTGRCLSGKCNQAPSCSLSTQACAINSNCCSGSCGVAVANQCDKGAAGKPCQTAADCTSNSCVGFVCQQA